jgi:hypothetical protein
MGWSKSSTPFRISNSLLLVSYFIIRIVLAPYFVFVTYKQTVDPANTASLFHKTIYVVNVAILACLSQYWFWKLTMKTFAPASSSSTTKRKPD